MKPLRFGIIGFGYFARNHARVIQKMAGAELVAVASRSISALDAGALPKSVVRLADPEEVLKNPAVDCVVIATPPSTHLPLMQTAAAEGKHIFVEKPTLAKATELPKFKKILAGYDRCFMVGHIYCYNDYVKCAQENIQSGLIGEVRQAVFRQFSPGPIRTDVDPLWEIGTHHLSVLEYIFGPAAPRAAVGVAAAVRAGGRNDLISAGIHYPSGLTASITVTWFAPRKEKEMMFVGDRGMIVFDDVAKKLTLYRMDYPAKLPSAGRSAWLTGEAPADLLSAKNIRDPMENEFAHFADCVRTGRTPLTGYEHAVRITEALDFISRHLSS